MKETDPVKKASEIQEKMQQWNMEDVLGDIPPLPKPRDVVRKSGVIDGMTHTWVEYVPPCYDGTTAVPLLVGLHGGSNNGEHFAATTLFTDIADRENFICLFPEASHYYDDEQGRHHIWNSYYFLEPGKSETGWLKQLIDRVLDEYNIDRSRIYLTGYSNGDAMALQLAVAHTSMFAAVAGLNGPTPPGMMKDADGNPEHPGAVIPYMRWNGERDPLGDFLGLNRPQIVAQFGDYWIRHNRCHPVPKFRLDGKLSSVIYESEAGAEYRLVEYKGGPHALNLEVAHVVWYEFFSRFARAEDGSVILLDTPWDASPDRGAAALAAGSRKALVDGAMTELEHPMADMDGQLMLPVSSLSRVFGAEVRLADDGSRASILFEGREANIIRDYPVLWVGHQIFPFPVPTVQRDGTLYVPAETVVKRLLCKEHSSESGVLYISGRETEISKTVAAKIAELLRD